VGPLFRFARYVGALGATGGGTSVAGRPHTCSRRIVRRSFGKRILEPPTMLSTTSSHLNVHAASNAGASSVQLTPIDHCLRCYRVCLDTALSHCLVVGGRHAEAKHIRMLFDCAEICRSAADLLIRGSQWHERMCTLCADACVECAQHCDLLGDARMSECAEVCRACAEACTNIAGNDGTA
jgi:hypothetical protein